MRKEEGIRKVERGKMKNGTIKQVMLESTF